MIDKKEIINFIFLISFPIYGVGTYVSGSISPFIGYFVSLIPYVLIILFYSLDLLYRRQFRIRVNWVYAAMLLYIFSCVASLFIALNNGLPDASLRLMIGRSLLMLIPFHAFIVVMLYNDHQPEKLVKLTAFSLSLLLAINLAGYYGLGLTNAVHTIEGRLSMPFIESFYSGANLLAILDLILLYYLFRSFNDPVRFTFLFAYFSVNMVLFYLINSRLSTLTLLLVIALFLFRLVSIRGLYIMSMFTIPILLSSGFLLYKLLQLPGLSFLMQRADIYDVVTFNGRAFLWKDAVHWLLFDQRGLFFGNGYKGHYFLDLIPDVVVLWNAEDSQHLHLHSTSLEILVNQGVVFFAVFALLFYQIYRYYKRKLQEGKREGAFFSVVVFLLFIMQVDGFVYMDALGFILFSLLISRAAVAEPVAVNDVRRFEAPASTHICVMQAPQMSRFEGTKMIQK